MSLFREYLNRQQPLEVADCLTFAENKSKIFVTIPCYDEPDLLSSLRSLANCTAPSNKVTVIVAVNSSDKTSPDLEERNRQTIHSVQSWWNCAVHPFYDLRLLHAPSLPSKWAGVGWARKIAMDEAIRCLDRSGEEEGILISFDADSVVSSNYFTSIERAFTLNPRYQFVTLNFIHNVDDPNLSSSLREGTILYELFLRYLRNAMQWCGYPHSIHTVGSSFAVKASAYVKQGGMNRRQAGEDFHFLHKIVPLGEYGKITDATVYPSTRISHRVPFGTGAALKKWEEGDRELFYTYSFKRFESLILFFSDPDLFFNTERIHWEAHIRKSDDLLYSFLNENRLLDQLEELKKNCAEHKKFTKRFFHLMNAFRIIQYLNLCENEPGGKGDLLEEASKLLGEIKKNPPGDLSARELLEEYRLLDQADWQLKK